MLVIGVIDCNPLGFDRTIAATLSVFQFSLSRFLLKCYFIRLKIAQVGVMVKHAYVFLSLLVIREIVRKATLRRWNIRSLCYPVIW